MRAMRRCFIASGERIRFFRPLALRRAILSRTRGFSNKTTRRPGIRNDRISRQYCCNDSRLQSRSNDCLGIAHGYGFGSRNDDRSFPASNRFRADLRTRIGRSRGWFSRNNARGRKSSGIHPEVSFQSGQTCGNVSQQSRSLSEKCLSGNEFTAEQIQPGVYESSRHRR